VTFVASNDLRIFEILHQLVFARTQIAPAPTLSWGGARMGDHLLVVWFTFRTLHCGLRDVILRCDDSSTPVFPVNSGAGAPQKETVCFPTS
jgi:hypothetical protein